jgi:selenoprotein W-related protein
LTSQLLLRLKRKLAGLTLVPATGGCFEVTVDGELVYSKIATGDFPNEAELVEAIAAKVK